MAAIIEVKYFNSFFLNKTNKINKETEKPSFIPWNLKLYDRASLNYKVDIVIAKK